jgi:hypothetical protein
MEGQGTEVRYANVSSTAPRRPRRVLGLIQPPSARVKRQGREAPHSIPSSADVNNVGAIERLTHMSSWCGA